MNTALRQIGMITRPHGLGGEVKVRPDTDDPSRFDSLEEVFVGRKETEARAYRIIGVRYQPMRSGVAVVLSLEGISGRSDADELCGLTVWADEAALPPLEDDEVYLSDLIGLDVVDDHLVRVGRVRDVLDLPAQPVLVIDRDESGEVLVPFVPAFIDSVDDHRIVVRPVEGLLDPDRQEEAV